MPDDYELTFVGVLVVSPEFEGETYDRAAEIEATFDGTMAELSKLTDAIDPSVSGSILEGRMEVSLTVEAEKLGEATDKADTLVRTALHAAGVTTKDWPADGAFCVDFRKVTVDDPHLADVEDAAGADGRVPA